MKKLLFSLKSLTNVSREVLTICQNGKENPKIHSGQDKL